MEKTIWTEHITRSYPEPDEETHADTAIIGGGLAGIMAAEALYRAGQKVVVLEADCIGGGESAKSSAMVSYAHDDIYTRLISKHGIAVAKEYLTLNKRGLEAIRSCIKNYNIECGWRDCDMVLFATTKKGRQAVFSQKKAYEKLGQQAEITDDTELPFPVTAALRISSQGMLNPYKFVTGLASVIAKRGVKIFENARVTSAPDGNMLNVNGKTIYADRFIVATHFPYINVPGWYFMKMYQSRSHNVAFRCDDDMRHIYESIEDDGFEYRPIQKGIIMCGGGAGRTGKNKSDSGYDIVRTEIKRSYDEDSQIVNEFSAQDCMTFDLLPFVGRYGGNADNVYVISGFNKWGFTSAAAAAELIADMFAGVKNKNIFAPSRLYMLKSPIKTLHNFGSVAAGYLSLLASAAGRGDKLEPGKALIIKSKGKRLGLYMHEDGAIDAIDIKCPHLGCGLEWNADEKTWDCSCHGSRFDTKGNIISNPATEGAHKNKD